MSFDMNPADEDPHGECRHEIHRLQNAIRKHRDQRGDDRCWMDDEDLYKVLPEGYETPERDTSVELNNCQLFIQNRRNPNIVYVSPQREIEDLKSNLATASVVDTSLRCSRRVQDAINAKLLEALRVAYRDISGDYSDGGEYRDKQSVIALLLFTLEKYSTETK